MFYKKRSSLQNTSGRLLLVVLILEMITVFIFYYSLYIKNVRKIFTLVSFCFCFIFSSNRKCKMVAKFSGLGTVFPSKSRIVLRYSNAVTQRCSVKEVILKISQNSQKNTCARVSFLTKLQGSGLRTATLLKKRIWHTCFSMNFAKILRASFFIEHLWWLPLDILLRWCLGDKDKNIC